MKTRTEDGRGARLRRQLEGSPDFEDLLTELLDTAEHLAGNPVVAWGAIKAEVERRVRDGELTPALAAQQILDAAT